MYRRLVAVVTGCSFVSLASVLAAGCGEVLEQTIVLCQEAGSVPDRAEDGSADGRTEDGSEDGATKNDGSDSEPKCTTGLCCSAGNLAGAITTCASKTEYQCSVSGCGGRRQQRNIRQYCSGTSADCDGDTETDAWQDISTCADDEICVAEGDSVPTCSQCPAGCNPATNACKIATLWIFKTKGAYLGNGFGGIDVPPDVRGGADGRCLANYAASYEARNCNPANVHAVLHVNASDSIELMRAKYDIPGDAPVRRAEDDVLVADNWYDLIGLTQLHAPASTATTEGSGTVWTGMFGTNTCTNWTSGDSSKQGARGYATRTGGEWLSVDTLRCDRLAGLLCVCW